MISLGLDLSCSVCGWAITENNTILDAGAFDISDAKTYKEKAKIISDGLVGRKFDSVNVEENLSGFAFGGTSQQVILKLAKNKAVICYILEEEWKVKFNYAHAMTMRKQLFGVARVKGVPPKKFVKENVEKLFDMSKWTILNKKGTPDKKMEDLYDAVVVSLYRNSV